MTKDAHVGSSRAISPYREVYLVQKDRNTSFVFRYVLPKARWVRTGEKAELLHSVQCPVCKERLYAFAYCKNILPELCHPIKRLKIHGYFWWKKLCPLEGSHYHFKCFCGVTIIDHTNAEWKEKSI